jgi:peptidyl-prolyl cis-trans isomerase A (cyclophilin A)
MNRRVLSIAAIFGLVAALGVNLLGQDGKKSKKAPKTFQAKFETTAGDFVIEVEREWAPNGADRFYQLVSSGFYDDCKFFRDIPDFMVQFGINGDPNIQKNWREATIKDDPVMKSNKPGYVTFATSGPDSRTTQIFINYEDNRRLDSMGFAPFGRVVEGMDVVKKINSQYGDTPSRAQPQIQARGNAFLNEKFPKLDGVKKATIVEN